MGVIEVDKATKYCAREDRSFPAEDFKYDEDAGGEVHLGVEPLHFRESGQVVGSNTGDKDGVPGPLDEPVAE